MDTHLRLAQPPVLLLVVAIRQLGVLGYCIVNIQLDRFLLALL